MPRVCITQARASANAESLGCGTEAEREGRVNEGGVTPTYSQVGVVDWQHTVGILQVHLCDKCAWAEVSDRSYCFRH